MYRIILASNSPRRKEILETMGIPCRIVTGEVEEVTELTEPAQMVQALSRLKAEETASILEKSKEAEDIIIIGADTMVFFEGHALGKPKSVQDAAGMLSMLSDHVHEVYSGVCIIIYDASGKKEVLSFPVCTRVSVYPLTKEQIMDYIATGEPMDKAGAYAIQGFFGVYIREIIGDYNNVVGLPIARIYQELLEKGIDIKK